MAFCANCGTQYNEGTRFCPKCGAPATVPGYTVPPQPAPYGGYAPPPQPMPYPTYVPPPQPQTYWNGKSKTKALVLAVLFSYWTFLYTFKRDKLKFLIGVVVSMIIGFAYTVAPQLIYLGTLLWLWAVITTASRNKQWFAQC